MIWKSLELRVEGGRVSHSWCMCVVSHGDGWLGGGRYGCGGWHAWGTKPGGFVVCREMPEHFMSARWRHWWYPITPPSRNAALGRVVPELVGFPRKALTWDVTRRLRFVVHAAGWLHSMVLNGRTCRGHTMWTLSVNYVQYDVEVNVGEVSS